MVSPLLPLLLSAAYFNDMDQPSRLFDQDFGLALAPEDLMYSRFYLPTALRDRGYLGLYYRPWADLLRQGSGGRGVSSIELDKEHFKITLDVQQFKPEEINVKVFDRFIVVTAKHEEKKDEHGLISRQFVRRYAIPENVDEEQIRSEISSDGVLTIQAPVKEVPEEKKNERTIKIEYTGKPAIKPQDQPKKEEQPTTTPTSTEDSSSTTETTDTSSTTEPK